MFSEHLYVWGHALQQKTSLNELVDSVENQAESTHDCVYQQVE